MAIRPFQQIMPQLADSAYVDGQAAVIGDVVIGADSSVWPMAVLRGDVNTIRIGARSSIQDGSALHVTHDHPGQPGGFPLLVGDDVTGEARQVLLPVDIEFFKHPLDLLAQLDITVDLDLATEHPLAGASGAHF